jgi:hypothetical protein
MAELTSFEIAERLSDRREFCDREVNEGARQTERAELIALLAGGKHAARKLKRAQILLVEIEIGVLRGQCLDRPMDEKDRLIAEIAAWEEQRNEAGARINWMFTTERARTKLARAYPDTAKES